MQAPRATKQDLNAWIQRAQRGDLKAYDRIVVRFQDMAVGYGYSLLHDFHWAEDAAQEAFLQAYLDLPTLQDPRGFAGWFRKIVFKHCDRLRRRKQLATVGLETVPEAVSPIPNPARVVEEAATRSAIRAEVQRLPEKERQVIALFYLGGCSHAQIGDFLELPITTVKKRLQTARHRLKERMMAIEMENDTKPKADLTRREALTTMAGTTAAVLGAVGADFQQHAPSRTTKFADKVARAIRELHAPNPDHDVRKMPWVKLYAALKEQVAARPTQVVSESDRAVFNALLNETQGMLGDDPVLQAIPRAKEQDTALDLLACVGQANHATCRGSVLTFGPMRRKALHLHEDIACILQAAPTNPAPENAIVVFNALLRTVKKRFTGKPTLHAIPEACGGQSLTSLEALAAELNETVEAIEKSLTETERGQPW